MNNKTIYIAVPICLILLLLSGCSRTPAGEIESVLNRCAEISKKASAYSGNPAAQAGYVADADQAIDISGCPQDFRVAFQEHVNAWRNAQSAFAQNSVGNNVIQGAVAEMTNNPGAINALGDQASAAMQDVNATYYRLTTIAAAYGARVPRSVVQ